MKRRDFIFGAGAAAAATALSGCNDQPAASTQISAPKPDEVFEWKLITTWPKNFPGLGLGPENFAKYVNTMSGGRLNIRVYGAGELAPALEVFDSVKAGAAEMGHGAAYYWKGKNPVFSFFTSVPFGLTAQEMNAWLFYGDGMKLWTEAYAEHGLKPLAGGNTGVQMAGWFNKEINSLKDVKGLKMRIPGLGGEVFSRAGGSAVNIPGGELYQAMEKGTIDATEWVGPYNDLAFGLHRVAKHYYYPGWHEPGPTLEIIINQAAFNALPEDLQSIVEIAARAMNQDMLDEYTARNNAALETLIHEHNVDMRRLPDDVINELRTISEEVVYETASQSAFGMKVFESFNTFKQKVTAYHDISERAYINSRLPYQDT